MKNEKLIVGNYLRLYTRRLQNPIAKAGCDRSPRPREGVSRFLPSAVPGLFAYCRPLRRRRASAGGGPLHFVRAPSAGCTPNPDTLLLFILFDRITRSKTLRAAAPPRGGSQSLAPPATTRIGKPQTARSAPLPAAPPTRFSRFNFSFLIFRCTFAPVKNRF